MNKYNIGLKDCEIEKSDDIWFYWVNITKFIQEYMGLGVKEARIQIGQIYLEDIVDSNGEIDEFALMDKEEKIQMRIDEFLRSVKENQVYFESNTELKIKFEGDKTVTISGLDGFFFEKVKGGKL